jgi:hypothetical protein
MIWRSFSAATVCQLLLSRQRALGRTKRAIVEVEGRERLAIVSIVGVVVLDFFGGFAATEPAIVSILARLPRSSWVRTLPDVKARLPSRLFHRP